MSNKSKYRARKHPENRAWHARYCLGKPGQDILNVWAVGWPVYPKSGKELPHWIVKTPCDNVGFSRLARTFT